MDKYKFPCGCEFPILEQNEKGIKIDLDLNIENINLNCDRTWDLISSGRTTGIFQIESQLGKKKSKELKPRNIEHLSALISIIRPGVLESRLDGKSLTDHYIDRKNGVDKVKHFHPALEPILKDTYSVLIYQEQVLTILKELAGFTLVEADTARRGIGKKKADVVAKVKTQFISKAEELGKISKEDAIAIFDWIEKGQRYLFNKSHGVSYAIKSYLSAYCKAHFPKAFFCSYLRWAKEKLDTQDARRELINDARLSNIEVKCPNLLKRNKFFKIFDNEIYVGLSDIKGIGESAMVKLNNTIDFAELKLGKSLKDFTWMEYLVFISQDISSVVNNGLMAAGALDWLKKYRTEMIYEYELYSKLTKSTLKWIEANYQSYNSILEMLQSIYEMPTGRGKPIHASNGKEKVRGIILSLEKPPYSLEDSIVWIAKSEDNLFGCSLTYSEVDDKETASANCTCRDFINGFPHYAMIAVKVEKVGEYTLTKGNNKGSKMGFIKVGDNTTILDAVIFHEGYKKYKGLLFEGNTVIICGNKGKGKDKGLIIDSVHQL